METFTGRVIRTLAMAGALSAALAVHAQATRTWVSGVGDDANPCSRTAPCKTWPGAISKTAAGGEINALDPGGFGAVTITKSITLNGEGTMASILVSGTSGIVVNAGPSDTVIIRNIEINGIAGTGSPGVHGISFLAGGELHLEKVFIYGFGQQAVNFTPSGTSKLFITNSSFRDNDGGGLWSAPGGSGSAKVNIVGSNFEGNQRGIRADDATAMFIDHTSVSGNRNNGIVTYSTSRPVAVSIENSTVSGNGLGLGGVGIRGWSNTSIYLSNVTVTGNDIGLQPSGGTMVSFGNNRVGGNITSDGDPTTTMMPR
jgi:hypothetical protein